MAWLDARLAVRFGPLDTRSEAEAVLTDGGPAPLPSAAFVPDADAHQPGCACCSPRSAAATALAQLFRDRATGREPPFRTVLCVMGAEGEAAVRDAVCNDPVASARYRL